jgi:hypothetical protein
VPGVAETIDWATALTELDKIALDPATISDTIGTLLKYQDDIARIEGSEGKKILDDVKAELAHSICGVQSDGDLYLRSAEKPHECGEGRHGRQHRLFRAGTLRKAGMKVGPAAVNDAIEAVQIAGIGSAATISTGRCTRYLVTRHEDQRGLRRGLQALLALARPGREDAGDVFAQGAGERASGRRSGQGSPVSADATVRGPQGARTARGTAAG